MNRYLPTLLIILVLLCSVTAAQSEDDPADFTLIDIQPPDMAFLDMVLSPDGRLGAMPIRGGICIVSIEQSDEDPNCIPTPENFRGMSSDLYWSPDSRYIAFHENFLLSLTDSDMWLVDVEALTITNFTDDGYEGSLMQSDSPVDYFPMWHPVTGDLYFLRSYYRGIEDSPLALLRAAREDDHLTEPEEVFDLTEAQPSPLSIYDMAPLSLSGGAAFSPDGNTLAMLARPRVVGEGAVLLLDMETGDVTELTNIVLISGMEFSEGMDPQAFALDSLAWANDGAGLVLIVRHTDPRAPIAYLAYYLDIEGDTTLLFDFSIIDDEVSSTNGRSSQFDMPAASVLSTDTNSLFFISQNRRTGRIGVFAYRLPPDDTSLVHLTFIEDSRLASFRQNTIGDDGEIIRVLLGGYLLTFER